MLLNISWQGVLHSFTDDIKVESIRYLLFAGAVFLTFYVIGRQKLFRFKIQPKFPVNKQMWREFRYSLSSITIFALVGILVYVLYEKGLTRIYTHFSDHSVGYFIFSVLAFIFVHDTYFYWTHRLMHLKKIYPIVHKIHHLSFDPTPWAAYAFHPVEAFVQAAIFPIMVCLIPAHPLTMLIWGLYQTTLNTLGHSGFELFPSGFTSHKIFKWSNTSTHHNMHHKYANSNYGLYFNLWDRLMGTNHPRYTEYFEGVVERSKQTTAEPAARGKQEKELVA